MDTRIRALLTANGQICTTGQLDEADVDELTLARLVRRGALVRIRRGLFAAGSAWREATPEQRLVLRTRAVLMDRPEAAASHMSAAVLHGLPIWGGSVARVDIVCSTPRRRLRSGIGLHPWPAGITPVVVDGQPAVPVPVAVAQVCVEHGVVPGLVCLDRALHEGSVTIDAVAQAGDDLALGPRAWRRLELVMEGSDAACESVGETRTRVLLTDFGLQVRSQVAIRDEAGFVGRVDFLVGDRVVVEFDGMVKYDGVDGRRALQQEKAREDRLRAAGYVVVRLVWADLDRPERVFDLVRRALRQAA
ncbi:type IV toxin-antitoxin system AbiEi family antitoxin domain-containing protein [Janibacter cremeus]|uniref:type IV toxin-antitoxin system AbiEi family antitoxin domain-containing protein n=1 Tax=Janibacter cremeus TaxID=1285192 RepID=UPI0023F9ECCA|nr:type IV toxin-antitoxin system AbiEi family antitoxin domain-containing protein [Janibacter cremeus]WEV77781.1 type IV toxin-antitoxin system AbiEi family antitoxin domain-containing protein [Janibacter cremeus]